MANWLIKAIFKRSSTFPPVLMLLFFYFATVSGQHLPLLDSQKAPDLQAAGYFQHSGHTAVRGRGDNLSLLVEGRKVFLLNLATAELRSVRTTQTTVSKRGDETQGCFTASHSAVRNGFCHKADLFVFLYEKKKKKSLPFLCQCHKFLEHCKICKCLLSVHGVLLYGCKCSLLK